MGDFKCLSEGTCTLTATQFPDITTTITIMVGAGSGSGGHDYYSDFEYKVNADGRTATIINYSGNSKYVIIPSCINGYNITNIKSEHQVQYDEDWTHYRLASVFHGNNIKQVIIPNSIVCIGENAFRELQSLTSINIPSSVKSIEKNAFRDCSILSAVTISEGIEEIGAGSFYGCSSLKSVSLPNSVLMIPTELFSKCSSLSSINLGNNIKKISTNAFYDCSSLNEIAIPDSVSEIESAFDNCISLNTIWFPANAKYTETTYSSHPSNIANVHITKGDGEIHDMDETLGCWGDSLLYDSKKAIEKVVICDGVTSIGYGAFNECEILNSISIPESVVAIESLAFANCANLNELHLPSKLKTIGATAFCYCNSLTEIVIPDSVEEIGIWGFADCENLKTITIPVSCEIEAKECFENTYPTTVNFTKGKDGYFHESKIMNATITESVPWCADRGGKYLKSVFFEDGIQNISKALFYNCSALSYVELSSTIKEIGDYAFCKCTELKQIVIPNGIEKLGVGCFAKSGLETIILPKSIRDAGKATFFDCESLESVVINSEIDDLLPYNEYSSHLYEYNGNIYYQDPYGFFEKCTSLEYVNCSNSNISNIGDYSFYKCNSLKSFDISEKVCSIGNNAFSATGLLSIYIPKNVERISCYAFGFAENNNKLDNFTIYGQENTPAHDYANNFAFTFIADQPNDITDRGLCNEYTSWEYYGNIHTLKLYGASIYYRPGYVDYRNGSYSDVKAPWNQYIDEIETIEICEGVTRIGYNAFKNHISLKTVIISSSVKEIEGQAFLGCTSLVTVVPKGNKISLGDGTFADCINLKNLGDTKKYDFYSRAFYNCKSLVSFELSPNRTSLGTSAFENCELLGTINLSNVKYLGSNTFKNCKALDSITFSEQLVEIGSYCFQGCVSLKSVHFPHNGAKIEDYAFENCTSLEYISLTDELLSIGNQAFYNTAFYNNESSWDNSFLFCDNWLLRYYSGISNEPLHDVEIKPTVKGIAESAFNSDSIRNISIPSSVTSICDYAFDNCDNLEGLIIPDSVTYIGSNVINNCRNISYVYYPKVSTQRICDFSYSSSISHFFYGGSETDCDNSIWNSFKCHIHFDVNPNDVVEYADYIEGTCANDCSYKIKCKLCSEILAEKVIKSFNFPHSYSITVIPPTCTEQGYTLHKCTACEAEYKDNYTDKIAHNYVDGFCSMCGRNEYEDIHSNHPYNNYSNESWTIHKAGAKRIAITFSAETETESGCDYIYLFDKDNNEIGNYTGTSLANKRVVIKGDTVIIKLTSDGRVTEYGFSLSSVTPYYDDCNHNETEVRNAKNATCVDNGYTGDTYCLECDEKISDGEIIPPTGTHTFKDGICIVCGKPDLNNTPVATPDEPVNVSLNREVNCSYFKFTPNQNGSLIFYSQGNFDTEGYLYDSSLNQLAFDDDYSDGNFRIEYNVEKNTEYILGCKLYSTGSIGVFTVNFKFIPDVVPDTTITDVYLTGDGNGSAFLNNAVWNPNDDSNKMSEVSDGVYEIEYKGVDAGQYQFKFAANRNTEINFGVDTEMNGAIICTGIDLPAKYNASNIVFYVEKGNSNVRVTLDLSEYNQETHQGATFAVYVTHVHSATVDEAIPADFEHTGLTEGSHCSVCGETIVPQDVLPKLEYKEYKDAESNVSVIAQNNVKVVVKEISTEDEVADSANTFVVANGESVKSIYEIKLCSNGEVVQPAGSVTVKIPCDNPTGKVYRMERDGTFTDMGAELMDGYLVFNTDHFSVYLITIKDNNSIGDVDGDGVVNINDATLIQKYVAELVSLTPDQIKAADTNGDSDVNINDATMIQKYIAELVDHLG